MSTGRSCAALDVRPRSDSGRSAGTGQSLLHQVERLRLVRLDNKWLQGCDMTDAQLVRVRRILDKLETVRSRELSCFGSDHHKFEVAPPLSEEDLGRFEGTHGVELPSCYRSFLRYAGSSGAGPHYGLFALNLWDDFAGWVLDDIPADFLRQPCPLRPGPNAISKGEHKRAAPSPYQGTLSIGSQGCSSATQLIVTGSYRGRVVYVDADRGQPYVARDPDFLAWYERWLDELLTGCDMRYQFGTGPAGDETALFTILADRESDDVLKAEAAQAFCRLPRLSEEAKAQMLPYLDHRLPLVRAGACRAVGKFGITVGAGSVEGLLEDADPAVRCEAVTSLLALNPHGYAERVKQVMHADQDGDVVNWAFWRLKDAGEFSRAEFLHFITAPQSSDRLRRLTVHGFDWTAQDEQVAISLLADADAHIRKAAVFALIKLESRAATPGLVRLLECEQDIYIIGASLEALSKIADPQTSDALLRWAEAEDDFHRIAAVIGLIMIGDERVAALVPGMLQEDRPPRRVDASGGVSSHTKTIAQLVRRALEASPNPAMRLLA